MPVTNIKSKWTSGDLLWEDASANSIAPSIRSDGGWQLKSANYTLTHADNGSTILVDAADKVITLPATSKGLKYTVVLHVSGLSASTGLSVSPAALDAIHGNALTSVDDKDLINTGATDAEGDSVTLEADGVDGWYITAINGTWAKEA